MIQFIIPSYINNLRRNPLFMVKKEVFEETKSDGKLSF